MKTFVSTDFILYVACVFKLGLGVIRNVVVDRLFNIWNIKKKNSIKTINVSLFQMEIQNPKNERKTFRAHIAYSTK